MYVHIFLEKLRTVKYIQSLCQVQGFYLRWFVNTKLQLHILQLREKKLLLPIFTYVMLYDDDGYGF